MILPFMPQSRVLREGAEKQAEYGAFDPQEADRTL
jgi:hypothetical protein